MIKLYRVGGFVRDEILGIRSKDLDFAVEAPSYEAMVEWVPQSRGDLSRISPILDRSCPY